MRKYKILSIVLIFLILFSTTNVLANTNDEVYNEGYYKGYGDGRLLAIKNNSENKFYTYEQISKPTMNQVWLENAEYLKDKDNNLKNIYYNSYIIGFRKGYEDFIGSYWTGGVGNTNSTNNSSNFGASLGMIYGEIAGLKDHEDKKYPNWSKAIPKDSDIYLIFSLNNIPTIERANFLKEFKSKFKEGYENTYYNAHFGSKKDSMDSGRIDGNTFGTLVGTVFGAKDFYEGRNANYNRNMPSDGKISTEYSLNRDNEDYIKGFIDGFKNSYIEAYLESFREGKNSAKLLEDSFAFENGFEAGKAKGQIQASMDYMEKKNNDWKKSQPLSSTIMIDYNLIYQTSKYRDSFINGFWDGYSNGYTDTYKALSQEDAINKITSVTVPISGGTVKSLDNGVAVEIDNGVFYKPVILNIDTIRDSNKVSDRFISASNLYKLSIVNTTNEFYNSKKIKISFEYYGEKEGGIYKLDGNKWYYLVSAVEDGLISAYINPSKLNSNGTVFAVLIDKKAEIFHDIRGHWAKDEITTFIKRGIINGYPDKTFKPDQYVTRAEFLILLGKLYDWKLPSDISNVKYFKDYETFNEYNEKYISYSLSNGYIAGYSDKYFKPYNHITYKELDGIFRRVLNNPSFNWSNYAQKMMYDKKTRSSSYDSYENKLTRAEFSYLLYLLNE